MELTSSDLPAWLEGVPTIAWLAKGDVALALGRRASQATINEAVSKDKTLVAPIWRNRAAEIRAYMDLDDPREWDSFSLSWLCTNVGDEQLIVDCCDDLLSALKAGTVRAILARGLTPITEAEWIAGTIGAPFPPMVYDKEREEWQSSSPALFWRHDIVKLRQRRLGHPESDGPSKIDPPPTISNTATAERPLATRQPKSTKRAAKAPKVALSIGRRGAAVGINDNSIVQAMREVAETSKETFSVRGFVLEHEMEISGLSLEAKVRRLQRKFDKRQ